MRGPEESPFSRRAAFWLVAVCALSFALSVALGMFGEEIADVVTERPSAYSVSAVGWKGFVETLRALDVPVVVSRHDSARKAGANALLVVAEPLESELWRLAGMLGKAESVLLVLPKWEVSSDARRREHAGRAALCDARRAAAALRAAGVHGDVVRPGAVSAWSSRLSRGRPILDRPQLLERARLQPIVWCEGGTLVGTADVGGTTVHVVSDPDLFSNHGLLRGDNAVLAVEIAEWARDARPSVVFDETVHGLEAKPTLWRELFRFPLALAVLHAAVAVGVLLWAGVGRFGAPAPPPPSLEPGNRFLVANTAELLRMGGFYADALARYLDAALATVARAVHAPPRSDGGELERRLDRLAKARGARDGVAELRAFVARARSGPAALHAARRVNRWKQEILHGAFRRP